MGIPGWKPCPHLQQQSLIKGATNWIKCVLSVWLVERGVDSRMLIFQLLWCAWEVPDALLNMRALTVQNFDELAALIIAFHRIDCPNARCRVLQATNIQDRYDMCDCVRRRIGDTKHNKDIFEQPQLGHALSVAVAEHNPMLLAQEAVHMHEDLWVPGQLATAIHRQPSYQRIHSGC